MVERIRVTEKQLSSAITVWLKKVPKDVWDRLIEQKVLAMYRRQSRIVDLDSELAAHIAREMTKHNWEVSYPEPVAHNDARRPQ